MDLKPGMPSFKYGSTCVVVGNAFLSFELHTWDILKKAIEVIPKPSVWPEGDDEAAGI